MNTQDSFTAARTSPSLGESPIAVPETGSWYFGVQDAEGRRTWMRHPTGGSNPGETWADAIRSLDHPSVPKLISVDSSNGVVEMQACDGIPLHHLLTHRENGELSLDAATLADLTLRLFDPLASAHAEGVVNGRICPDTVWMTQLGGLALWGWGEPDSGLYDPTWRAPEHAEMGTPASDVWSGAALVLALGAGKRLRGRPLDIHAARTCLPELFLDLGEPGAAIADALIRALAADPELRPTAADIVAAVRPVADTSGASRLPRLGRVLAGGYAPRLTKRLSTLPKKKKKPRALSTMPVTRPRSPAEPQPFAWTPLPAPVYEEDPISERLITWAVTALCVGLCLFIVGLLS